jgi:hypothetical protein
LDCCEYWSWSEVGTAAAVVATAKLSGTEGSEPKVKRRREESFLAKEAHQRNYR